MLKDHVIAGAKLSPTVSIMGAVLAHIHLNDVVMFLGAMYTLIQTFITCYDFWNRTKDKWRKNKADGSK